MSELAQNLEAVQDRMAQAALRAGRRPEEVRLVAVSKTKPASAIVDAFGSGQLLFGENYVQELVGKLAQVPAGVRWHFIGSLQSNKVRQIAGRVELIHSVDRISLGQEIDRQWGALGKVCEVLVQVNISQEATKGGTTGEALLDLIRQLAGLPHLKVAGLMTIPPFFDEPDRARPFFRTLRELSREVTAAAIPGVEMRELSMGMSGDFEAAIEEGATLVRVGSALFGAREYR